MISFVIPTLNETTTIENTLEKLLSVISPDDEVIVVDGRSEDDTVQRTRNFKDARLVEGCARGRALQMNAGAEIAGKEYILFLHADTTIDSPGIKKLKKEIGENKTNWGWFTLKLDSPRLIYRVFERLASYRTMLAHEPLGDHGIFVRTDLFKRIGGYPEIPIMEDIELVKKLRKISPGKRIDHHVLTSVRRFERGGILKTAYNICMIRVAYFFGMSPQSLSRRYLNHR